MKKALYSATALCLLLTTLFSSCAFRPPWVDEPRGTETAPVGQTTTPQTTSPDRAAIEITSDYRIVSNSMTGNTQNMRDAIQLIGGAVRKSKGFSPERVKDSKGEIETEIILGDTRRASSAAAKSAALDAGIEDLAGVHLFVILSVGKQIAVYGTSDVAVLLGARRLCEAYLSVGTPIPSDLCELGCITDAEYSLYGEEAKPYSPKTLKGIAILGTLCLDGIALDGFAPDKTEYTMLLNRTASYPTVSAKSFGGTEIEIEQASEQNGGSAAVTVKSPDKSASTVYSIRFTRREYDTVSASIEKVKDGKRAIVVIVHDDGDLATCRYLSEEFQKNDLVGTIAMISSRVVNPTTGALNAAAIANWQALLDTGRFSISSHTQTHKFWGMTDEAESGIYINTSGGEVEYSYEAGQITREVAGSQADLRAAFPSQRVLTFVKAGFGTHASGVQISDKAYDIIDDYYITMRNTGGGVDTIPAAKPHSIKSYMVSATDTVNIWTAYVDRAIEKNGMIVYLFHGIADSASGLTVAKETATPFFAYVGEKKAAGDIWVATFEEASLYTEELRTASVEARDYGNGIEITLTDEWDNTIYNAPLTVRIDLPADYAACEMVDQIAPDGSRTTLTVMSDGAGAFVYANIVPDAGIVRIIR